MSGPASPTRALRARPLVVYIDGVAFWSPALPGWRQARLAANPVRSVGDGDGDTDAAVDIEADAPAAAPPRRPSPSMLAANERRRAPDSVLLALQVAQDAVADSGHDPHDLSSIFTSAYGDLPIVDALCRTLADDPRLLSPTRFHHSVHNAASGYWAIASGSHAASTAVAAGPHSFAAGLLEAVATVVTDDTAVLLVGFDTEARGPLASVNTSRGLLGVALVLAPERGPTSRWRMAVDCHSDRPIGKADCAAAAPLRLAADHRSVPAAAQYEHPAWQALRHNAQADALPLFEALAQDAPQQLTMALGAGLALWVQLHPVTRMTGA